MSRENDGEGFVSAAEFFRQQAQSVALDACKATGQALRKPPRESLLVVARNSQVKNKINAFDKSGSSGSGGAPKFGRPSATGPRSGHFGGSGGGLRTRAAGPQRRAGTAPSLGAIAEEPASLAATAAPARRHAAVVSTAGAPARQHAALMEMAAAPNVVLPSPGTKQQVAEKQHEARFPSIMFLPPAPGAAAPARAPLPGSVAVPPVVPAPQLAPVAERVCQPHPLPAVLAPVLRASLPPQHQPRQEQLRQTNQLQQASVHQALAAVLVAEESLAAASAELDDEHYVDADSGSGSGIPSNENSSVWADARDGQHTCSGRLVIQDEQDGDAASVESDASTVVPDHKHYEHLEVLEQRQEQEEEEQPLGWGEQAPEPTEFPDPAAAVAASSAPEPELCDLPLLRPEATVQQPLEMAAALATGAAKELFQSAGSILPSLDGSRGGPLFGVLPARRRSSNHVAATPPTAAAVVVADEKSLHVSVVGGIADAAAAQAATAVAVDCRSCSPPPSQHSREPSMVDTELLPAAAATPQQPRLNMVTTASPAGPTNTPVSPALVSFALMAAAEDCLHGLQVPASAVTEAIEQAVADSAADDDGATAAEASGEAEVHRASLTAEQLSAEVVAEHQASLASAAASPVAASLAPGGAQLGAVTTAPSPVPVTPYAITEYDGDDVVMMDVDFSPAPNTGHRAPPGSIRFQADALASASQAPTGAVLDQDGLAEASGQARVLAAALAVEHAAAQAAEQAPAAPVLPAAEQELPVVAAAVATESAPPASPAAVPAAVEQQDPAVPKVEEAVPAAVPALQATVTAAKSEPIRAPAVEGSSSSGSSFSLAPLSLQDVLVRRGCSGRLSMPTSWQAGGGMEYGARASRLSLPSEMAAGQDAASFAPRPKLAVSPLHAEADQPAAEQAEEPAHDQEQYQLPAEEEQVRPKQQGQAASEQAASSTAAEEEEVVNLFSMRSRLAAEEEELPAETVAAALAAEEFSLAVAPAVEEPAAAIDELAAQQAAPEEQAEQLAAAEPAKSSQQQLAAPDEDFLAATDFAAKPKLAMSPVLSFGATHSGRSSYSAAVDVADSAAVEPRPKLSLSPAGSSGSMPRPSDPVASPADIGMAASICELQPAAGRLSLGDAAATVPVAASPPLPAQYQQEREEWKDQPTAEQQEQEAAGQAAEQPASRRDSWSTNLLACAATPAAGSSGRLSHSPALSGLPAGAVSNNPMYAATPSHPTPPSVNLKSFFGGGSLGGTPQSVTSGGSTPASVGMQLVERLHQVAEQLQSPAAPASLAALATPGGAKLAVAAGGATPATGCFKFAADVEAMIQALEARTPATAMGQQPALGQSAAVATTVHRVQGSRLAPFSFAASPNTLLDLDSFDANGNLSSQVEPMPLLHQQLLGATPAAAAAASGMMSGGPCSGGAGTATPAEVRALREEVDSLRTQLAESNSSREEVVGLLGGYQSSIRELQDQHSVEVVHLQGELAALRAEKENLQRAHAGVDAQFRTLYSDKYQPLKAEAAGLRQEVAALQKQVIAEELRAHKAVSEVAAARQELAVVQEWVAGCKAIALEREAEAAAAREGQQHLQQQLAGEQRRTAKAVAAKEVELGELRAKHGALTRQYDEAVHRINLAKQARERAQLEAQRKEEEVVALEVRLKEYEGALREYKKENGKFFEMKERYKSTIAALEKDVQGKEQEKAQLLSMCNELMTRLEREGLSL